MLYFRFNEKPINSVSPLNSKKKTLWNKLVDRIGKKLSANPDFDDKLKYVAQWYLEYDDECDVSCREIGLDINKKVIVKMPDERNYGFWLDTNLTLEDFKAKYDIQMIQACEFNNLWDSVYYDRNIEVFRKIGNNTQPQNGFP